MQRIGLSLLLFAAGVVATTPAPAQDTDALAKQLSNPVASLTSVPIQFNWDTGVGASDDGHRVLVNVQPVVPVRLSDEWNLISRTVVPIVHQHDVFPGAGTQTGLGDVLQSAFFSPSAVTASGWVWGIGPALLLPTATDDLLGGGRWAGGPTAVALRQTPSGWTYGALANHLWSFGGDADRADISATYLQPFVSRSLGQGRTLSASLESTFDWRNEQWNVPLIVSYSKVSRIGTRPVSWQGGVRRYVEAPDAGAEWGLRFTVTLLYPKR